MSSLVSISSDTKWAVQLQVMARGLKFRISEGGTLYYLCKIKGADQLGGHRAADLSAPFPNM